MRRTINIASRHITGIVTQLDQKKFFLLDNSNTDRLNLFTFAVVLGMRAGKPVPIEGKKESFVRTENLGNVMHLFRSIYYVHAIVEENRSIDDITDDESVLTMMEQYADRGFDILEKDMKDYEENGDNYCMHLVSLIRDMDT